jgi:hypothetical protein
MTSKAERARIKRASRKIAPVAPRYAAPADKTPKVAKLPPPKQRDGLAWLIQKKRLTPTQAKTAKTWRDAARDATGVSIRSCIDDTATGSGGPAWLRLQAAYVASSAAQMWLDQMRREVLRGQADMLTVLDGVCGAGHTLRDLAGGNDRRAGELEAILRVALDLVGAAAQTGLAEAA